MQIVRNFLNPEQIEFGRSCFKEGGQLDYFMMDEFVRNSLSQLNPSAHTVKYRASNNTNRSDAAHFHRDIVNYGDEIPEVYTVLFYLDNASMEVIPDSHLKPRMNIIEGMTSETVTLDMYPGDLLIFNACTLHRGKFATDMGEHRRLIQVFDTTFGEDYTDRIMHLPCIGQCKNYNFSGMSTMLSKIPFVNNLSRITFINTCTGYGGTSPSEYTIISQESGTKRYLENGERIQKDNLYRILDNRLVDVPEKDWYRVHHAVHERTLLRVFVFVCIILLIVFKLK